MSEEPSSKKSPDPDATQIVSRDDLIGKEIGAYKIQAKIGQGGMGTVYLAWESRLEREVALKFLPESLTQNKVAIERFIREARNTAKLEHSNVVSVLAVGEESGRHYITMQYVPGGTLDELLKKDGTLDIEQSVEMMRQVAAGLAAAHDMGIIHRDIKPENIMIDRYGKPKVTDFGLAISHTHLSRLTHEGQIVGTPYIMSPEQCDGKEIDARSDIYSLGVTFFRSLTGSWPYEAETPVAIILKHLQSPVPVACEINDSIPKPISDIIEKMMAKNVDERYQTMTEVIEDLDRYIAGLNSSVETVTVTPSRWKWMVASGLALIVIEIAVLKYFSQPESGDTQTSSSVPQQKNSTLTLEKEIAQCLEDIEKASTELLKQDWKRNAQWDQALAVLNLYEISLAKLKQLDPSNANISVKEADLSEIRRDVVTHVADNVISQIDSSGAAISLDNIRSLDKRVLNLSRVSDFVFDKLIGEVEFRLSSGQTDGLVACLDYLNEAWLLNVTSEQKKHIQALEKSLREALPDTQPQKLIDRRLELVNQRLNHARQMPLTFRNTGTLILIYESILADYKDLNRLVPGTVTEVQMSRADDMIRHWAKYNSLKSLCLEQLEAGEYDKALTSLFDWRQVQNTQEVIDFEEELAYRRHISKGEELEKSGDMQAALVSYIEALKIRPRDVKANNAKERIDKALADLGSNLLEPRLNNYRLKLIEGKTDEARKLLMSCIDLANNDERVKIRNELHSLEAILRDLRNAESFLSEKKWQQALDAVVPIMVINTPLSSEGISLPKASFIAGQALYQMSLNRQSKEDFQKSLELIDKALEYQPGHHEFMQHRKELTQAWVNVAFKEIDKIMLQTEKLTGEGDFDKALKLYEASISQWEHQELIENEELKPVFDVLHKKKENLETFMAALYKMNEAKKSNDWNTAQLALEEASRIANGWPSFDEIRRSFLYSKAQHQIATASSDEEKLLAYWGAWASSPEDRRGNHLKELNEFRLKVTQQLIGEIKNHRDTVEMHLSDLAFEACAIVLDEQTQRLDEVSEIFTRHPQLSPSEAYQAEKEWWVSLANRLQEAQVRQKSIKVAQEQYDKYIKKANDALEQNDLTACLVSLKNAQIHVVHLDESLQKGLLVRIKEIEEKIKEAERQRKSQEHEIKRREQLENLITEAVQLQNQFKWLDALNKVAEVEALMQEGDLDLLPDNRTFAEWKTWLKLREQDRIDYENVLKSLEGVPPEQAIEDLKRFIRVNKGNHYVNKMIVQQKIQTYEEALRDQSEKKVSETISLADKEFSKGRYVAALKMIDPLLVKYPDNSTLQKFTIQVLTQARASFQGGDFKAGSEAGENVGEYEQPPYQMTLKPFELACFEVTNLQWKKYIDSEGLKAPAHWVGGQYPKGEALKPVHHVSFVQAQAFARWAKAELPSEFEWEYAARETSSDPVRWPWGNVEDASKANVESKTGTLSYVYDLEEGATKSGCQHMSGNVSEWTESHFLTYPSKGLFSENKPKVITKGARTVRGGSLYSSLTDSRTTARKGVKEDSCEFGLGFRLAWDK